MNAPTVTLSEKQWKSFCKVLRGLARACNDVVIDDGIIRQRSNDSSAIFEVDLKPIVGGATFTISNFKEKLKTLKTLKSRVTITLGQSEAVFSDALSFYSFPAPDRNYLDNKFMNQQELESLFPAFPQETFPLIKNRIEKIILKRIRITLSRLKTNTCKVVFAKHSASLRIENETGKSKQPSISVDIIKDIPLFEPTTGYAQLPPLPFKSFDFDGEMGWELYRVDKRLFSKIYGRIGEIKATTYTKAELKINPPGPVKQVKGKRS